MWSENRSFYDEPKVEYILSGKFIEITINLESKKAYTQIYTKIKNGYKA